MAVSLRELLERFSLPVDRFISGKGRKPSFYYVPEKITKIDVDTRALKQFLNAVVFAEENGYTKDAEIIKRIQQDAKKFSIKVSITKNGTIKMTV